MPPPSPVAMFPLIVLPSIVIGTEVGENAAAVSYYWLARRRARESVVTDVAPAGQLNGPVEDRTDPAADLDRTAGRECVVPLARSVEAR